LYYFGARYYNPVLGRFITKDIFPKSIYYPQTHNHYSYCINNPLKYIDKDGYNPILPIIGVADLTIASIEGSLYAYEYLQSHPGDYEGAKYRFFVGSATSLVRSITFEATVIYTPLPIAALGAGMTAGTFETMVSYFLFKQGTPGYLDYTPLSGQEYLWESLLNVPDEIMQNGVEQVLVYLGMPIGTGDILWDTFVGISEGMIKWAYGYGASMTINEWSKLFFAYHGRDPCSMEELDEFVNSLE
jgi:hypothetical protein